MTQSCVALNLSVGFGFDHSRIVAFIVDLNQAGRYLSI